MRGWKGCIENRFTKSKSKKNPAGKAVITSLKD